MVGLQRLVVVGDARSRKANEVEEENEEGRVARTLLYSRGIFYLLRSSSFLAPFSPCLLADLFPFLPRSPVASISLCPQFGSRGGKACIIRRNSTGITLQYGSHPVIPLLPFFVEQLIYLIIPLSTGEAAPLLVRGP